MSDGIAKPETEGEKRAQLLRKLATWEDNVSRGVEQLETYRRMVLNQEENVASDTKRRDELRAEVAALFALTPEGKEALLESQPEPIPTEVRKQDEQDAADLHLSWTRYSVIAPHSPKEVPGYKLLSVAAHGGEHAPMPNE